jgi:hypothetical protein
MFDEMLGVCGPFPIPSSQAFFQLEILSQAFFRTYFFMNFSHVIDTRWSALTLYISNNIHHIVFENIWTVEYCLSIKILWKKTNPILIG